MKIPSWINAKSVCSTVFAGVILGLGTVAVNYVAKANDSHVLTEQTAKAQAQSVATQTEMAMVVKQLAKRHAVEDAQERLYLQLCLSGKLAEPNDCDEAKAKAAAATVAPLSIPVDPAGGP
jgi:hypothetical protein